jgi:radical SAM superfamily enzyme YgiQ (UPF0313 family)
MRVMLVYSNRTRILEPAPPIGLSYVASATRRAGHDVRFVDLMISREPLGELTRALDEFRPDVVGFSLRNIDNVVAQRVSWHLNEVSAMISVVREQSRAKIVLGGPAASILGAEALEQFDADFVVVGEGELVFPKLLSAISGPQDYDQIAGVCYRRGSEVVSVPAHRQTSFTDSGMEQWIDWPAYERGGGAWAIHTKRGCPLSCVYCNYPVMEGHQLRQRSAADVVDEIERVKSTVNPRTFEFTDSTFNVPESHAVAICEEIIRRKLRVNLSAVGLNPLTASPELFALMKRAGFCSLVITADSASPAMLRQLRKRFTIEDVERTARLARESRIRCTWFLLLGGPGETRESVEETISFAQAHLTSKRFLTIFMTGIRILPGTQLATYAAQNDYIPADQNLSSPIFYFAPELDEQWVLDRIDQAIARCPNFVHGAEQNDSRVQRAFYSALYRLGIAPPYYRFLPTLLRIPPLPALRAKHTGVRAACGNKVQPAAVGSLSD